MSPFQLLFGGTFGTGSRIAVSIHSEDLKKADSIRRELFKTEGDR